MDKSLERLSWVASIGSFIVTVVSVPWLSHILGFAPTIPDVGGFQRITIDVSSAAFGFRISAALFLVFAYCWLSTLISVAVAATGNPAGHAFAAILTFFTAVVVVATVFAVGFNSFSNWPIREGVPTNSLDDRQWALLFWVFVSYLIFNVCAWGRYGLIPEQARNGAGVNSFVISSISFVIACALTVPTLAK